MALQERCDVLSFGLQWFVKHITPTRSAPPGMYMNEVVLYMSLAPHVRSRMFAVFLFVLVAGYDTRRCNGVCNSFASVHGSSGVHSLRSYWPAAAHHKQSRGSSG